jgi:hypothetical protein
LCFAGSKYANDCLTEAETRQENAYLDFTTASHP